MNLQLAPGSHRLANAGDKIRTSACEEISVPTFAPLDVEKPHAAAVNQAGSQKVKSWWIYTDIEALDLCVLPDGQ